MLLFLAIIILIVSVVSLGSGEMKYFFYINSITVLLIILGIVGVPLQIGEGYHTGIVTAINRSGIIMKSTAVYIKTDANSSQENIYCLLDSSLRPQLQKLQEEKKNITIGYYNVLVNSLYCPIKAKGIISSIK